VSQVIWDCCQSPRIHHPSIFDKYSDRRFKKASIFVEGEVLKGVTPSFLLNTPTGSSQSPGIRHIFEEAFFARSHDQSPHPPQDMGLLIPIEG